MLIYWKTHHLEDSHMYMETLSQYPVALIWKTVATTRGLVQWETCFLSGLVILHCLLKVRICIHGKVPVWEYITPWPEALTVKYSHFLV